MADKCFIVGFNHQNANVEERSRISIGREQEDEVYRKAKEIGADSFCILNTCNRTEFFGRGDIEAIASLYTEFLSIDENLQKKMMRKTGVDAMKHFYQVASGLDSQIVGDLQIPGQFKSAVKKAREMGTMSNYFQRLVSSCFQASKEIRTQTSISDGTTSLSYAVVKMLKDKTPDFKGDILLIGTGKFGISIAQNVKTYFPNARLCVANRTASKAAAIADKIGCEQILFSHLHREAAAFDVVITAIDNAKEYALAEDMLGKSAKKQLFFDMSIPIAIDPRIAEMPGKQIVTIDEASSIVDRTIEERRSYLPLARQIIEKHLADFMQWTLVFQKSDYIKSWKNVVLDFSKQCPFIQAIREEDKEKALAKCMADFTGYIKSEESLPKDPKSAIEQFIAYHRSVLKEEEERTARQSASV